MTKSDRFVDNSSGQFAQRLDADDLRWFLEGGNKDRTANYSFDRCILPLTPISKPTICTQLCEEP